MKDLYKRDINYMRISITDRCNLRCRYCMPESHSWIPHNAILRYEEILRICRSAIAIGISNFKITGGEPLVRKGAIDFISRLKKEPGVKSVTLTTNGILLEEMLPALKTIGIDGVNISLDAIDKSKYKEITGTDHAEKVLSAIERCAALGLRTKVNSVLLYNNTDQIISLAALSRDLPVDMRFIELMPIGNGQDLGGPDCNKIIPQLTDVYPDLHFVDEKRGNGPAAYYKSSQLKGRIGFIAANSHQFCDQCNRIRLTSTGLLKTCLCYDSAVNLGTMLRNGLSDTDLQKILSEEVLKKPSAHCFSSIEQITEHKEMSRIGG